MNGHRSGQPKDINLFTLIILISLMSASIPRKAEAIYQTLTRLIDYYSPNNSVFLTLTTKKQIPLRALRLRVSKFHRLTKHHFSSIFTVMGVSPFAIHVHSIAIVPEGTDLKKLKGRIKRIKAKVGFSQVFSMKNIESVPAVCRYMAWNYSETSSFFAKSKKKKIGRLSLYRDVPRQLLVKGTDFTRNTPAARKYRATLTRLAGLAGTDIGDWRQLERATGKKASWIMQYLFGLFQRIPCGEHGLSSEVLSRAFPSIRPFGHSDQFALTALASDGSEVEECTPALA